MKVDDSCNEEQQKHDLFVTKTYNLCNKIPIFIYVLNNLFNVHFAYLNEMFEENILLSHNLMKDLY